MAHPARITVSGVGYDIPSEAEWNNVSAQIDNFIRTGRQLVAINYPAGTRHVLLTDHSTLDIWVEKH